MGKYDEIDSLLQGEVKEEKIAKMPDCKHQAFNDGYCVDCGMEMFEVLTYYKKRIEILEAKLETNRNGNNV